MLETFIREYTERYERTFSDGFKGEFERFCAAVLEPSQLPSAELKERLNALNTLFYEPLSVAVVGQFSSGKSSFLNAILGADILPTGIIPVTAKPTFIKYAPQAFLKALYEDGREEYLSLDALGDFVDQRKDMKAVKALYIHLPNEILKKVSFIDTPGLNSRSAKDTAETMKILKECSGLIWLSLIDNAARAGELNELSLVPKTLKNHAICALNQKDKLNDEEIKRVLNHSKITYNEYFSEVCAISAKMQRAGQCDESGFKQIFSFLDGFSADEFIKANLAQIKNSLVEQNRFALGVLDELTEILESFDLSFNEKIKDLEGEYKKSFLLIFDELKQNASFVAEQILSFIAPKECEYFKSSSGIFGKKIERASYQAPLLDEDAALLALIYNDDKLAKMFNKLKRKLIELKERIKGDLQSIFDELKNQALDYKARFESVRKDDALHSDILFAHIREFSCDTYGLFFLAYERELEAKFARLDVFFERLNIKIATNYASAVRLSLSHLSSKIATQRKSYESDPLSFALFYPSLEYVRERVLGELCYYEFEGDITSTAPFSTKFLLGLKESFSKIKEQNIAYITALKTKQENSLKSILALSF